MVASNKFNPYQSKIFFVGASIDLLLNTQIFKRNIDLKPFIEKHFISNVENQKNFGDYLYLSRTALAARLSRLIFEKMNYTTIIKTCKSILDEFPQDQKKKSQGTKNILEESTDEWMDYISKGDRK